MLALKGVKRRSCRYPAYAKVNQMHTSLIGRLYGHTDSINCLAPSGDGVLLASGGIFRFSQESLHPAHPVCPGHDGLHLWDLKSLHELRPPLVPEDSASRRGQVTCLFWLPEWTDAWRTLCFGTALGYIVFWQETVSVSDGVPSSALLTHATTQESLS